MSLIPYQKIILNTTLSSTQITEKIRAAIEPPKGVWQMALTGMYIDSLKPFHGTVGENGFKLMRIINYRNSFLPVIEGKIDGPKVEITLRTSYFVTLFMLFWLGMVSYACVVMLFRHKLDFLLPGGMFIFGCCLWTIPFNMEAKIAKQKLGEILGLGSEQISRS